ncbi:hypothetical protein, partial [Helicobacter rodentium]
MTEQQVSLQYIYDPQELIKTIDRYCKNAQKIKLYSTNFLDWEYQCDTDSYYLTTQIQDWIVVKDWLKKFLGSMASPDIKIEIHDYCPLDSKDMKPATFYVDSNWKETEEKSHIQVFLKQSDTSKILYDFIEVLNPNKKNLDEALKEILDNKDKGKSHLQKCIIEKLQEPLIKQITSLQEAQDFDCKLIRESLTQIFENILRDIEAIYAEGSAQLWKEAISFFLNITSILEINKLFSKANILITGTNILLEGEKLFLNFSKWYHNRYNYAIYKNLIKLLIEDIAPILWIVENKIFHQSLIIDDKICIEFSGLDTNNYQTKAGVKQGLVVCFKANGEIFKDINDWSDFKYHHFKNNLMVFGKNHIKGILEDLMRVDNNRLTFIESPFFNSIKLAKMIQENKKNQDNSNESNKAQNYLIITNAPQKHNAGLNQKLIEEILGNKIHYPDTTKDEKYNEVLAAAPEAEEATINYSQYKITINDKAEENKAAFVLSLSPFLHIDYKDYEAFKKTEESYRELQNAINDETTDSVVRYMNFLENSNNMDKILSYHHIQQYFTQPNNIKAILEKEEQYFKKGIDCIQNYINSIIEEERLIGYYDGTTEIVNKQEFTIMEVFLLALTYYVIKNFYTSIKTDCKSWWQLYNSKETLTIENQAEINILPANAHLNLEDDKKLCLCFSKKRKQELLKKENQEVFCIEELVDCMEQEEGGGVNALEEYLNDLSENKEQIIEKGDENLAGIEKVAEKELQEQIEIEKEIKKLYQNLKKQEFKYDNQEALNAITETFIDEFFPLKNAFEDTSKLSKLLAKAITQYCNKGIQEAFYTLFGFAYLPYVISKYDIKITQPYATSTRVKIREKELSKKALCSLIYIKRNAENYQVLLLGDSNLKGLNTLKTSPLESFGIYRGFLLSAFKRIGRETLNSLPQALAANLIKQLWITHYEKIREEYQRVLFFK